MTQDDIIRMAEECGAIHYWHLSRLERFAALVADAEAKRIHDEGMVTVGHMREQIAAEREACALVVDKMLTDTPIGNHPRTEALFFAARNIRARGNT